MYKQSDFRTNFDQITAEAYSAKSLVNKRLLGLFITKHNTKVTEKRLNRVSVTLIWSNSDLQLYKHNITDRKYIIKRLQQNQSDKTSTATVQRGLPVCVHMP